MLPSPDTTLQPITHADANIHTGHPSSSFLPPRSPFPPNSAVSDDSRPVSSTTTHTVTADNSLQVAEECHARQIRIMEEKHAQDLEALKRAYALELIETKLKLYTQHQRDLVQLKEASEDGLRRLRAFFLAVKEAVPKESFTACLPADGDAMALPLRVAAPPSPSWSTTANASDSTISSSSPCPSTPSHGSSSVIDVKHDNPATVGPSISPLPSPLLTPPQPAPPTASSHPPHTSSATNPSHQQRQRQQHVHFLTTGLSPSEAKKAARSDAETVAFFRRQFERGLIVGRGERCVRSAVRVGGGEGDHGTGTHDDNNSSGGDEKGEKEKEEGKEGEGEAKGGGVKMI